MPIDFLIVLVVSIVLFGLIAWSRRPGELVGVVRCKPDLITWGAASRLQVCRRMSRADGAPDVQVRAIWLGSARTAMLKPEEAVELAYMLDSAAAQAEAP